MISSKGYFKLIFIFQFRIKVVERVANELESMRSSSVAAEKRRDEAAADQQAWLHRELTALESRLAEQAEAARAKEEAASSRQRYYFINTPFSCSAVVTTTFIC